MFHYRLQMPLPWMRQLPVHCHPRLLHLEPVPPLYDICLFIFTIKLLELDKVLRFIRSLKWIRFFICDVLEITHANLSSSALLI